MRCKACNKILNDHEATIKYKNPKLGYVDMCVKCLKPIRDMVKIVERDDLRPVNKQQNKAEP